MAENPYQEQTDANTKTTWLSDQKPVDVDLDGMVEFAKNMVTIKGNLSSHTGYLELLSSVPANAWNEVVLPEGAYARAKMLEHYGELQQYTAYLGIALENIGMAAQTIADIYRDTDGWSSADLNSVNFVFGDSSAQRPSGLPSWFPVTTYWDEWFKQRAEAQNSPQTGGVKWEDKGETRNPDGSTSYTSVAPDGRVMEIRVFSIPGGGGTVTTTTVKSPDGKVLSTNSQRSSTYLGSNNTVVTTTTSYDGNGNVTGGTTKSTTYGAGGEVTGQSTVNTDKDGNATTTTRTVTNSNGTQTIQYLQGDKVVREVVVGAQTTGSPGVPDSEIKAAQDRTQEKYDKGELG